MELSSIDEFLEMYVPGAKQITRKLKILKTGAIIINSQRLFFCCLEFRSVCEVGAYLKSQ